MSSRIATPDFHDGAETAPRSLHAGAAETRAWSDRGGHVQLEFLQCHPEDRPGDDPEKRPEKHIEWRIARPELSLIWMRNAAATVHLRTSQQTLSLPARAKSSFCFFPAGIAAEATLMTGAASQCAGLFIDPHLLSDMVADQPFRPLLGFQNDGLDRSFAALLRELGNSDRLLPYLTRACAMQAFAHVARDDAAASPCDRGTLAPWQIRRATGMLQAEFGSNPSVAQVAQACRLSPSHFARCFRASTGLSPHQWVLRARIRKAQELMHRPDAPLADVALACGFADQSHFCRVFRRLTRMTPKAWRRTELVAPQ